MKPTSYPRIRPLLLVIAMVTGSAAALHAHDFWLVPDAFRVSVGSWLRMQGQTSSKFPTSEAAVGTDRIADARIFSATEQTQIRELSRSGTSLVLRHRPTSPGQRIVAVTLHPRSVRESAEGFRRYLELEGAPEALERYQREGMLPTDSITRRYAKYAKTLVEVGPRGSRAFSRVVGHPAEFIPLSDPAALAPGDTLRVRLLYRGQPLARAKLHAGSVASRSAGEERAVTLETDAEGITRVPIDRAGLWNLRALHIVPAVPGSGADWDTHWVTLVFGVEPGAARPTAAGSDSAAVVAVVDRFHRALATGDSVAALNLLTSDATILESGGIETKAEYRSHHLPGDIAFARAVSRERGAIRATVRGDVAWATSTSTGRGEYRGRAVNSAGAELMVLTRTPDGWRISAVHWSSRTLR